MRRPRNHNLDIPFLLPALGKALIRRDNQALTARVETLQLERHPRVLQRRASVGRQHLFDFPGVPRGAARAAVRGRAEDVWEEARHERFAAGETAADDAEGGFDGHDGEDGGAPPEDVVGVEVEVGVVDAGAAGDAYTGKVSVVSRGEVKRRT